MKAITYAGSGGAEALALAEMPAPRPQAGEVLVRVHAAAVTPAELQWYPTRHTRDGGTRPLPVIPGHEFSGTIAELGPDTEGAWIDDAVFGLNDWFAQGAQAEFVVAPRAMLAPKPRTLTHGQAAVVPISALTAWQALVGRARLRPGERVLIHGAAGGVGAFAVQIAHAARARVIATASSGNVDFVRELGADEVIDYRTTRFDAALEQVDVILDTVGGDTLARSWPVLAPGGRLVSVASSTADAADPQVRAAFMLVQADRDQLSAIARQIDVGQLRVFVDREYPLADAPAAYVRAAEGGKRGKVALRVTR